MKPRSPWEIQKTVVLALILRELKTRFGVHRMGAAWLFLEPMVHVAIMMAIFGFARSDAMPGIDFSVFLLVGVVPFLLFKSIALRIMEGVEGNKGLFTYRHIKPMDVFLSRAVLETALYSIVLAVMLLGLMWLGFDIAVASPLEFLLLGIVIVVGGFGFGLVLSVIAEFMPEAKPIIRMLFMPLYLLSGVIFPVAALPRQYREWLLWNPVLHAIELARDAFLAGYRAVPEASLRFVLGATLAFTFVGLALYRERRLAMVAQ
jgi:capsular polysaccharide transport system permease protein